ncbi:MAG: hypothetical protein ACX930_03400 [Erythrobacter sp.]
MALKDLVSDKSSVNEETIEKILAGRVRFDPDQHEIILTKEGRSLAAVNRALLILVANEGWVYVDESETRGLKPKEISEVTGIKGGTLRPALRDLADENLVRSESGEYRIVVGNLNDIEDRLT